MGLKDGYVYLEGSVRGSTQNLYAFYWKKFLEFCGKLGWASLPASPNSIAAFMVSLAKESKANSGTLNAKNDIVYYHRLHRPFEKSPTDLSLVKKILKTVSNKWSKPVRKVISLSFEVMVKFALFLS